MRGASIGRALDTVTVFFVQYVCVLEVSVLPPAPLRRQQRMPRRWDRTPRCRCMRWSMQPAAYVGVPCVCALFVGMFAHACRFFRPANRVIEHKVLCVCVSGSCFLYALVYFCSRVDMLVGTHKRHPVSLRPHPWFLHAHMRTHWVRPQHTSRLHRW